MANVIGTGSLSRLLAAAEDAGARFAWIADDQLMLGREFGRAGFVLDLGAEALVELASGAGIPNSSANAGASRNPGEGAGGSSGATTTSEMSRRRSMPALFDLPPLSGRQTGLYRLTLESEIYAARSQKEVLLIGLTAIERAVPGTLDKLEGAMSRTKRVVSRRRELLNKNMRLADKYSEKIEGGWWVFTNNSFPETQKFVRRAAFLAGLSVRIEQLA